MPAYSLPINKQINKVKYSRHIEFKCIFKQCNVINPSFQEYINASNTHVCRWTEKQMGKGMEGLSEL